MKSAEWAANFLFTVKVPKSRLTDPDDAEIRGSFDMELDCRSVFANESLLEVVEATFVVRAQDGEVIGQVHVENGASHLLPIEGGDPDPMRDVILDGLAGRMKERLLNDDSKMNAWVDEQIALGDRSPEVEVEDE